MARSCSVSRKLSRPQWNNMKVDRDPIFRLGFHESGWECFRNKRVHHTVCNTNYYTDKENAPFFTYLTFVSKLNTFAKH